MSLYVVQLVDDEHTGAVGREIARLVDHLPVRTDREQLRMKEAVQLLYVASQHRRL